MLNKLIALANKLDKLGQYDLASEVDEICKEAITWVDKRPESERRLDPTGLEYDDESGPERSYRVEKELKNRPGEDDPRRWLIDEEGVHPEDRSESTPSERLKSQLPGRKREDVDPDTLSEEELDEDYLTELGLEPEDFDDPVVELLEQMKRDQQQNPWED